VSEALGKDSPVVVHCMSCGRARNMDPWHIAKRFGALPFGMLVGKFLCRRCNEKMSVVLPWYANTPRAWASAYEPPKADKDRPPAPVGDREFNYRLDLWRAGRSGFERTLGWLHDLEVGHAAFDAAVKKQPKDDITLRSGANVIRDSARPAVKPLP